MMTFQGTIACASSNAGGNAASFALGEVMIKFRSGTEAASAVSRASRTAPPNLENLAPTSRLLTEKTGIPLRVQQLLSGDWVLFAIDLDRLAARAAAELLKQQDVTDVRRRAGEAKDTPRADWTELEVVFRAGSPPAALLEERAKGAQEKQVGELAARLGERLGLPLRGTADTATKHLLLRIDLAKLTSDLAERLRNAADIVDSVQLNYIMTPM